MQNFVEAISSAIKQYPCILRRSRRSRAYVSWCQHTRLMVRPDSLIVRRPDCRLRSAASVQYEAQATDWEAANHFPKKGASSASVESDVIDDPARTHKISHKGFLHFL